MKSFHFIFCYLPNSYAINAFYINIKSLLCAIRYCQDKARMDKQLIEYKNIGIYLLNNKICTLHEIRMHYEQNKLENFELL